jgi:hypothetical protein
MMATIIVADMLAHAFTNATLDRLAREAGDEMVAAGSGRSATDTEPTGELGLARGRERRSFLVADADPFDFARTHDVANRIERVGN